MHPEQPFTYLIVSFDHFLYKVWLLQKPPGWWFIVKNQSLGVRISIQDAARNHTALRRLSVLIKDTSFLHQTETITEIHNWPRCREHLAVGEQPQLTCLWHDRNSYDCGNIAEEVGERLEEDHTVCCKMCPPDRTGRWLPRNFSNMLT